jgi:hypothetical protein
MASRLYKSLSLLTLALIAGVMVTIVLLANWNAQHSSSSDLAAIKQEIQRIHQRIDKLNHLHVAQNDTVSKLDQQLDNSAHAEHSWEAMVLEQQINQTQRELVSLEHNIGQRLRELERQLALANNQEQAVAVDTSAVQKLQELVQDALTTRDWNDASFERYKNVSQQLDKNQVKKTMQPLLAAIQQGEIVVAPGLIPHP